MMFVIAIKYLSRCYAALLPCDFSFHLGSRSLKLSHLSFANDLYAFSRGDVTSVKVIIDVLNHFDKVSGLQVNDQSSVAFLAK